MPDFELIKKLYREGAIWVAAPLEAARAESELQSKPLSQTKELLKALKSAENFRAPCLGESRKLTAAFGVPEIDGLFPDGGLPFGGIHEFFAAAPSKAWPAEFFAPPCTIPTLLMANALKKILEKNGAAPLLIWIGRECWPAPFLLQSALRDVQDEISRNLKKTDPPARDPLSRDLLARCIFVAPPNEKLKLWCLETALRSPAVAIVTAGINRLSFAASRKFALIAKKNFSLGLFIRPPYTPTAASAGLSRWRITPCPSPSLCPRWQLELVKCKGAQPAMKSWIVEEHEDFCDGKAYEKISLHLSALMADQPGAAARPEAREASA